MELALRKSVEHLCVEFRRVPFEPYAPIRRQLLNILRAVNGKRKAAAKDPVPTTALRLRRRVVRPFEASRCSWINEPYSGEGPQDEAENTDLFVSPGTPGHREPQLSLIVGGQEDAEVRESSTERLGCLLTGDASLSLEHQDAGPSK